MAHETLDFGQRDLRGTALYGEIEEHFRQLHEPAFGRPSAAADPDAHPDGTAIAFTGTVFTGLSGLGTARVCLAQAGSVSVVTDGPGEQNHPRFSPDGTLLAYLSDAASEGDFQLRIRTLADGTERTAEPARGTVEYLAFSPDGRNILLGVAGHGADRSGAEGSVRPRGRPATTSRTGCPRRTPGRPPTSGARRGWSTSTRGPAARSASREPMCGRQPGSG